MVGGVVLWLEMSLYGRRCLCLVRGGCPCLVGGTILGGNEAPYIGEEFGDIFVGFWWGLRGFKKVLIPMLDPSL